MNKKIIIAVLLIAVVATAGYFIWKNKDVPEIPPNLSIKVGAILPLSGDVAVYGKGLQNGMDLALEEYKKQNKNSPDIQIIYEDSKADPKTAVTIFQKLMSVDKCNLITGGFSSSEALSIAPIAEQNKIVFISPTASAPTITNAGDYIFRTTPSDNFDGDVMARFAFNNLKLKTVSILFINNEYGQGIAKVFKERFEALGGKVPAEKSFNANSTDFKTQLSSIKSTNSDGLYVIAVSELGTILKQKTELGLKEKVLTVGLAENPKVVEVAGKNSDPVFYSYPSFQVTNENPVVKSFVDNYKQKYTTEPDVLGAYGYDLMNIIIKSLQNSNYDQSKLKDALYGIQNFQGVTGETSFDKNGDVIKTAGIKKIVDGKFEWEINKF